MTPSLIHNGVNFLSNESFEFRQFVIDTQGNSYIHEEYSQSRFQVQFVKDDTVPSIPSLNMRVSARMTGGGHVTTVSTRTLKMGVQFRIFKVATSTGFDDLALVPDFYCAPFQFKQTNNTTVWTFYRFTNKEGWIGETDNYVLSGYEDMLADLDNSITSDVFIFANYIERYANVTDRDTQVAYLKSKGAIELA